MEDLKKFGEVFYDGGSINLNSLSIDQLNEKLEKISLDENKIKSEIYKILENF